MKKTIIIGLIMLMSLHAQAQLKVIPKLTNGLKMVYVTNTANATSETEYLVSDVSKDGAVITVTDLEVSLDTIACGHKHQIEKVLDGCMNDINVQLKTDSVGHVLEIMNADEVKSRSKETAIKIVNKMLASSRNLDGLYSDMQLLDRIVENAMETIFLNKYVNNVVLALNGKIVTNGMSESFVNNDVKMKHTYFINGAKIIIKTAIDMSDEEMKTYIIKKIELSMPDNVEMVKANIDMLLPQLKEQFGFTSQSTYELSDDGWVKSVKVESEQSMMGQSSKQEAVITRIK